MHAIESGISLTNPNVKRIDTTNIPLFKIYEAPQEQYNNFINAQERFLEAQYTTSPDTSSDPRYQTYATIEHNGKTIAHIDNNGFIQSSNTIGAQIQQELNKNNTENGLSGPALAQHRAEHIADLLGGKLVKSSTSLTQNEFNALPKLTTKVDHQSMKNDPMYEQLLKTKEARTLFLAQQMKE